MQGQAHPSGPVEVPANWQGGWNSEGAQVEQNWNAQLDPVTSSQLAATWALALDPMLLSHILANHLPQVHRRGQFYYHV